MHADARELWHRVRKPLGAHRPLPDELFARNGCYRVPNPMLPVTETGPEATVGILSQTGH